MTHQGRKRPDRNWITSCFDEVTLAALVVLLLVVIATMFTLGVATAGDRLGCGLNDIVDVVMAYPRGCH